MIHSAHTSTWCTECHGARIDGLHARGRNHHVAGPPPDGDLPVTAVTAAFHQMEICPTEAVSPIKQDIKKGKLRDYNMPIKWNYGSVPT